MNPDGRTGVGRRWRTVVPVAAAMALTVLSGACGQSTVTRDIAVSVSGDTARFQPETITVDKGDTIVWTVTNPTDREHGFSIAGLGVETTVGARNTGEVRFTASRAGTFRIFCQLHETTHQTATLVVR